MREREDAYHLGDYYPDDEDDDCFQDKEREDDYYLRERQ